MSNTNAKLALIYHIFVSDLSNLGYCAVSPLCLNVSFCLFKEV